MPKGPRALLRPWSARMRSFWPVSQLRAAGEAVLLHLLGEAQTRGYRWLGLETGRPEAFLPALRLYEKHGFAECPAFGDYVSDEFSLCMEKWL